MTRRCGAAVPDDLLDLRAHGFEGDVKRLERLGGDPLALVDQTQEDVLGPDVVVIEQTRFLLREHNHSTSPVGEALKHLLSVRHTTVETALPFAVEVAVDSVPCRPSRSRRSGTVEPVRCARAHVVVPELCQDLVVAVYRTTFDIDATPGRVWEVLTDLQRYPEWNPQIPAATGKIEEGSDIGLRLKLPGRPALNVTATIERSEPGRSLTWRGHVLAPGFFQGYRSFDVEPSGDGARVTHLEEITGIMAPVFSLLMGTPQQKSHAALNEALKERAAQPR
jgi:hypothetical protein